MDRNLEVVRHRILGPGGTQRPVFRNLEVARHKRRGQASVKTPHPIRTLMFPLHNLEASAALHVCNYIVHNGIAVGYTIHRPGNTMQETKQGKLYSESKAHRKTRTLIIASEP